MGTTKKNNTRNIERVITFEITTVRPLPVGQQVFIAGNIAVLGKWEPDGFPLTRLDDNLWSGYTPAPVGLAVEFKITRGRWANEETEEPGIVRRENLTLAANGNVTFKHTVSGWLDQK